MSRQDATTCDCGRVGLHPGDWGCMSWLKRELKQRKARIQSLEAELTQKTQECDGLRADLGQTQYSLGSQLDAAQELLVADSDLRQNPGQYWVTKNALDRTRSQVAALTEVLKQAQEAIQQAHKALSMKAHATNCNIVFHGCDCGSFENFEPERAEFYRQKNNLEISKASGE